VTLLVEGPAGRHFAQFHRDADALTESAFVFLEAGLRRSSNLLVVAGAELRDRLYARFAASDLDAQALCDSGQLAVLDAAALIKQFVHDGVAEWAGFRGTLGPILTRLHPQDRRTRVYTEMANILWDQGNTQAAIRLEEFWNAMAAVYRFSLYCGFRMDTQSERTYAGPLEELGRTHAEILGTPEDELFGLALDRAAKEMFGTALTQMAGLSRQDGARRFPSGQRTMLWVKRHLPDSTVQLVERARHYLNEGKP
jgi:hypothetical protein